jgi:AraC-like DNA-binding protein
MITEKIIPIAAVRSVWTDHSLTIARAADRLGVSRNTLARRAAAFGLPARPQHPCGRRPAKVDPDTFIAIWNRGDRLIDMSRHFDRAPETISKIAKRMGLPRRGKGFVRGAAA